VVIEKTMSLEKTLNIKQSAEVKRVLKPIISDPFIHVNEYLMIHPCREEIEDHTTKSEYWRAHNMRFMPARFNKGIMTFMGPRDNRDTFVVLTKKAKERLSKMR
jgi:hypothetical protein